MKEWKAFEKRIIDDSKLLGITCIKIPEAVTFVRSKNMAFQRKTPFDFVCSIDGRFCCFDAKYCDAKSYSIHKRTKKHQIEALESAHFNGDLSGLLIYFKPQRLISWVKFEVLKECILNNKTIQPEIAINVTDRELINLTDLVSIV